MTRRRLSVHSVKPLCLAGLAIVLLFHQIITASAQNAGAGAGAGTGSNAAVENALKQVTDEQPPVDPEALENMKEAEKLSFSTPYEPPFFNVSLYTAEAEKAAIDKLIGESDAVIGGNAAGAATAPPVDPDAGNQGPTVPGKTIKQLDLEISRMEKLMKITGDSVYKMDREVEVLTERQKARDLSEALAREREKGVTIRLYQPPDPETVSPEDSAGEDGGEREEGGGKGAAKGAGEGEGFKPLFPRDIQNKEPILLARVDPTAVANRMTEELLAAQNAWFLLQLMKFDQRLLNGNPLDYPKLRMQIEQLSDMIQAFNEYIDADLSEAETASVLGE